VIFDLDLPGEKWFPSTWRVGSSTVFRSLHYTQSLECY